MCVPLALARARLRLCLRLLSQPVETPLASLAGCRGVVLSLVDTRPREVLLVAVQGITAALAQSNVAQRAELKARGARGTVHVARCT